MARKPRSSARFIAYEIRPSKQLERRLILDVVLAGMSLGLPISSSTYVGMGGFKFYDFIMFSRYLGLQNLISIEGDNDLSERCSFNKPFENIQMFFGDVGEFILDFSAKTPHVVWFDHDHSLTGDLRDDLVTFGSKLPAPSFFFVTVSAQPNNLLSKKSMEERHDWFLRELTPFSVGFSKEDFQDNRYRFSVAEILLKVIRSAFHMRLDAQFSPVLKLIYRDSAWMVTVGGLLAEPGLKNRFEEAILTNMAFLLPRGDAFYEIPQFNISESERRLLDRATTHTRQRNSFKSQLKRIGFDDLFIRDYQNLIRYIPRYHETFL